MFEFKLPDLGEGVHEGQIVSVLVNEGDTVNEYQPLMEVETDKAAVEIPSPKAGRIARLNVKPGQTVKVGEVLLVIDESATGAPSAPARGAAPAATPTERPSAPPGGRPPTPARAAAAAEPAPAPAPPGAAPAPRPTPEPLRPAAVYEGRAAAAAGGDGSGAARGVAAAPAPAGVAVAPRGPVPAAPVVRKLARELGIDLHEVRGSGPGGRVLREDVERYALQRGAAGEPGRGAAAEAQPAVEAAWPVPAAEALPDFAQYGPIRRVPAPQIRKTIARQMTRAWLNVARVTHGDEADITELERNRRRYNESLREGQAKLTITAIVLKAVAAALREFPMLNCSYDARSEEIVYKDYIHLGVAVDTPRGLVVPVVRDVDRKSLPQVAAELNELSERVRAGKFEIAELRGATFTVTNVGALGGTFATPMVNFPEVGILGLGRARQTPVVLEGQIVARLMMPLFLSFDHRMVDGADAARFTREVVQSLENPLRLISM